MRDPLGDFIQEWQKDIEKALKKMDSSLVFNLHEQEPNFGKIKFKLNGVKYTYEKK